MESFEISMIIFLLLIFLAISCSCGVYDCMYVRPIASEKANIYCQDLGFDQYKEFSRVGIFSKEPIAIKCEFAERYTDLGIRSNVE